MDTCQWPRCRQASCLKYIEVNLCKEHWATISNAEPDREPEYLARIGLVRNSRGSVVPARQGRPNPDERGIEVA